MKSVNQSVLMGIEESWDISVKSVNQSVLMGIEIISFVYFLPRIGTHLPTSVQTTMITGMLF